MAGGNTNGVSRRGFVRASGIAVVALIAGDGAAAGDPRLGAWARGDGDARVMMAFIDGKLCATNTWIRDSRSGEKVGDRLIFDVSPAGAGVWSGTAYDPQRRMTFSVTLRLIDDQLLTEGWILGGLISKTARWTRA
ncbi:MAG: DUF2147 domain-containing protein [Roseiarcus sp.]